MTKFQPKMFIEKSMEFHNHKPQPIPYNTRKRKKTLISP